MIEVIIPCGMQAARIVFASTSESGFIPYGPYANYHHPVVTGNTEPDERWWRNFNFLVLTGGDEGAGG